MSGIATSAIAGPSEAYPTYVIAWPDGSDDLNVGESGQSILFNACRDISAASNILRLKSPTGCEATHTVEIGNVDVNTSIGIFSAYQFVIFTTATTTFDQAGTWQARIESTFDDKFIKTNWLRLKVRP